MKRWIGMLLILALLLTLLVLLSAFRSTGGESADRSLIVIQQPWTGWSEKQPEPIVTRFEQIKAGSVIYEDTFGVITVKSVSGGKVRLSAQNSSFVKPNRDGTINLNARQIRTLTIRRGKQAELVSATMDCGVKLTILYR